jgi:mono/diheme cytochrome c family protein
MRRISTLIVAAIALVAACGGDDGANAGPADPGVLAGGERIYDGSCKVCHGSSGQGGAGSALDDVLSVFPDCEEQVSWITLGSTGWEDQIGPTYGAVNREIERAMPGFDGSLSEAEIRLVAAWQRYRFGAQEAAAAASACGVPG